MITVGMNYHVAPGKGPEFEDKFGAVLQALEGFPGHVATQLFQDVNDRASYLIHSEWESNESFGAFMRSDEFAAAVSWAKEGILDQRPKHQVYKRTEGMPGGPPGRPQ